MSFMLVHQKGKPVLIDVETIKQVHMATKGNGAFLVTDDAENNLEVDEDHEVIMGYLTELQIEVELFANDD